MCVKVVGDKWVGVWGHKLFCHIAGVEGNIG